MKSNTLSTPMDNLQELNVLLATQIVSIRDTDEVLDDNDLKKFTKDILDLSLETVFSLAELDNTAFNKNDITEHFKSKGTTTVAFKKEKDKKEQYIATIGRAISYINCSFEYGKLKGRNILWSDRLIRKYFSKDLKKIQQAISLIVAYGFHFLNMSAKEISPFAVSIRLE